MKPLPTSIKEKETHWPREPLVSFTREKEELVRIWKVTSSPLPQIKAKSQKKLALKLHAHPVHYAHKLVQPRRSLEHFPHFQSNRERYAGLSACNPPNPHRLLSSFMVKGLFFPCGPLSLIVVRRFFCCLRSFLLILFILFLSRQRGAPCINMRKLF